MTAEKTSTKRDGAEVLVKDRCLWKGHKPKACPAKKTRKFKDHGLNKITFEDRLRYKSHNSCLDTQPGNLGLSSEWQAGPAYLSKERTDWPFERKFADNKSKVKVPRDKVSAKYRPLMDGDIFAADLVE